MTEKTERCVERKEPIRSPDWCYMFLTPDRKWQVELADKDEGGSFYGPYETPQEATAVLLALDTNEGPLVCGDGRRSRGRPTFPRSTRARPRCRTTTLQPFTTKKAAIVPTKGGTTGFNYHCTVSRKPRIATPGGSPPD